MLYLEDSSSMKYDYDVLVIDEIDKFALTTDYKAELIFNLLDSRNTNLKHTI